ncbi:DUF2793 domain-containing protein [Sphingomonas montanisoli]|uniref:DUF2793 domain-containing protein n=1 Tax=Sphingomonas montanisoli TaxID=2606412 RepID=A0A5D9CGR6_9SPHN|nr:DUF2793 domain-containing protein [Sphingomonas montanisoli]TZG29275.1 DUF2793 domain-containing protein [Sphingomonas montanisoli]
MTDLSPRFGFPFLLASQAQKEVLHNEALQDVDMLLHPVVQAVGTNTPPAGPANGQCWIVGDAATGAWAGHGGELACRSAGGWRFVAPQPGMAVWSVADAVWAYRVDTDWVVGEFPAAKVVIGGNPVLGARRPAIANPVGGSVVDIQARSAIVALLDAARAHGLISA